MGRIIGIVSSKGGVGKTTVTINLSAALMKLNKNVIAVDTDVKTSSLGLQLGLYEFHSTLNDKLNEGTNIFEALYIHPTGLRIIPASVGIDDANISRLKNILNDPIFDNYIVLVDGPPGLGRNAMSVLEACREIIIVTTPDIPSIANVIRTSTMAEKYDSRILGIIVNRYRKKHSEQLIQKEIEIGCNLPVIGIIPEDETIAKSIFRRVPNFFLNPCSPSSIGFGKIASFLVGERYKQPNFVSLRRLLRR